MNVALTVPLLPSVTVASLTETPGGTTDQSWSLNKTETLLAFALAVATSSQPSPLKSPVTNATGRGSVPGAVDSPKFARHASYSFARAAILAPYDVIGGVDFAIAIEVAVRRPPHCVPEPTAKFSAGENVPSPRPRSTLTSLLPGFAAAISSTPSRSKSPRAHRRGLVAAA